MRRTPTGQAGFTLIELMISLVISSVLVAAGLSMGSTVMASYRDHRRVSLTLRSARVSLDIVADAVRNASPAVPSGQVVDLVGCGPTGALRAVDNADEPDELEVIYGSGGSLTSLRAPFAADSAGLLVNDASGFAEGDLVVVGNLENGHLLRVTAIDKSGDDFVLSTGAPKELCADPALVEAYPAGALVVRARMARFFVGVAGGEPTLMLDPDGVGDMPAEPLAQGVEDFQVAIGVDTDGDETVSEAASSTDEWFGNASGDAAAPDMALGGWRAVRLSLVARTMVPDVPGTGSARPTLENREGGEELDGYRRRSLSATVEVRNLTGSP